jgi:hypothetical protein
MIIVLCNHEVLVWGIPPLSPHPPDLLDDNPTHISPLLKTSLPDNIARKSKRIRWEMILDWYAGPSQSIHLGVSTELVDLHNVEIVIKPDLSDISLHVINTCQLTSDFYNILRPQYHIFEDHTHVSEGYVVANGIYRIYIRSTSSPPPDIISPESPIFLKLSLPGLRALRISTSCPASGRFVYFPRNTDRQIVVVDFLKVGRQGLHHMTLRSL